MTNLNMANMNTLFKKGYLLAGVVMAANMFIVNEMKAMETEPQKTEQSTQPNNLKGNLGFNKIELNESGKGTGAQENPDVPGTNILDRLLSHKNIFNLIGEEVFSGFNNSFKWWDYNPGWYGQFGCFGWKSKKFLYSVLQFEFNCNLGRGALWSILHVINSRMKKTSEKSEKDNNSSWASFFLKDILRGFTSMPLTFHIHKFNFSISFSLDSMIWAGVDYIIKLRSEEEVTVKKGPKIEGDNPPTNTEINLSNSNENNKDEKEDKPKDNI